MSVSKIEKLVVENAGAIRKTEDWFSVYDLISICGKKSPREVWKRLSKEYPEVVNKCDSYKFPGKGQQFTPVVDRKGLLYILGLLPGQVGKDYREDVANIIYRMLAEPGEVAADLVENAKSEEEAEMIAAKTTQQYLSSFHSLFSNVKQRGGGKDTCMGLNHVNTRTVRGNTPRAIVAATGAKNGRQDMSLNETVALAFLQEMQNRKLDKVNAEGHTQIMDCCNIVANALLDFIEDCTVQTVTV
jgi:hypothetical protein